jgi:hypothetical protein
MSERRQFIDIGEGTAAIVSIVKTEKKAQPRPTKSQIPGAEETIPEDWPPVILPWASWGTDNLFPQDVVADMCACGTGKRALMKRIETMYGNGVLTYKKTYTAGKENLNPQTFSAWTEFCRVNNIHKYLMGVYTSYEWFYNPITEIILSKDRSQIVRIDSQDAAFCRWQKRDLVTGKIKNCYISMAWPYPSQQYLDTVPVLDEDDPVGDLQSRTDSYKYIIRINFPTPNKTYYMEAYWEAARAAGWVNISASVAQFKQALFKNQITIKYHIQIQDDYWEKKFGESDWAKKTQEKKAEAQKKTFDDITNYLQGVANAGRSIQSTYFYDAATGKESPGIKINVIDDKIKDGQYLPDSQQANSEILFAIGIDPTLIGAVNPGDKSNTGSGSDKRESQLLLNASMKAHREINFAPLRVVRDYNALKPGSGWDPDMEFGIQDIIFTTLDVNPTGSQKVTA